MLSALEVGNDNWRLRQVTIDDGEAEVEAGAVVWAIVTGNNAVPNTSEQVFEHSRHSLVFRAFGLLAFALAPTGPVFSKQL